MKKLKKIIDRSFSLRMGIYILLMASSIFVFTSWIFFNQSRKAIVVEAVEQAHVKLNSTILQIDKVLNSVEIAVENLSWLVIDKLDQPEYMYELTQQVLRNNPYVVGSSIAFEPSFYPEKGVMFSPYSYRAGEEIQSKQLGTEDYEYHYMDWYQIPKLLEKPYWSEPYYDKGGANLMMTTYSRPLYDAEGKLFAIFTADISLEWLTEKVTEVKLYPNSLNYLIGRGGTFLVNNRPKSILNESYFAKPLLEGNKKMLEIGHQMVNGETGMGRFNRDNIEYYLFFAPITTTGWSVSVAVEYDDIFVGIDNLRNWVITILVLGVLLLSIFSYFVVHKLTDPIVCFANSANELAKGNFNVKLPVIKSKDEMKILHDSFEYMQKSLVDYIDKLEKTTANKERIESELRIARNIQMGMVPKIFPPFPEREDLDIYAKLIPAKEVGGDLYDFFIKDNKLYFIVGDVSGKGVPASLVMAVTCRLFRTVADNFYTPAKIMKALNEALSENNDSNMFCTAFIGILNLKTGFMQYCNAGHNAPVVLASSGEVKFMEVNPNLPLGLFSDFPYEGQECDITKDTSLLLYTDGVTEAENMANALYSDIRLLDLLRNQWKNQPQTIADAVMDDINKHANGAEQSDDITIMCIHYR